jgi:hypothetical protein
MPKWIAAVLVLGCLCAPGFAGARADQVDFTARLAGSSPAGDILGVPKEQVAVVGAGIVAGALVLHLVVPGDFTYFAGGVVGGLAALWWYEHGGEARLRPTLKLDRATAVVNARGGPVLEGIAPGLGR